MPVTGWDLLVLNDGTALLLLYAERSGDVTPEAVPIGPLPTAEARRLADWMCTRGWVDAEEVHRHVEGLDRAGAAMR
jgi:hypothetical protein